MSCMSATTHGECDQSRSKSTNRISGVPAVEELEFRELALTLGALRTLHRALDAEINHLNATGTSDQVTLMRLKKRKLRLRDEIQAAEDALIPDIIA
jgi:hypothetical protein